jgi:hypothetical protein
VLLDDLNRAHTALGLADHGKQAQLQHHVGELVHARCGGRAGGADDFAHHRIDRADIIDCAALEIDRQRLTLRQHVLDALVRGVAPGQHLAVEQQAIARLPALHHFRRQRVEIDLDSRLVRRPVDIGPFVEIGLFEIGGPEPSSVKCAWRVAAQLGIIATGLPAAWQG